MTIVVPPSMIVFILIIASAILGAIVRHVADKDLIPIGVICMFFIVVLAKVGTYICH